MPALNACRYNPDFHLKCDAFVAAGKPAKVTITAVMRKLVLLANTLISQDQKWEPRLA
jgi:transposase